MVNVVMLAVKQVVVVDDAGHEMPSEAGHDEAMQSHFAHMLQNVTDECQVNVLTCLHFCCYFTYPPSDTVLLHVGSGLQN